MVRTDSLLRSALSCFCRAVWVRRLFDQNFAVGCDAKLSVGDHEFTGCYSAFNHNQILLPLTQCNRALLSCLVSLDDIDERTFGRHLRSRGRNQNRLMDRAQHETNVYKAAWPETMSRVRNSCAEINRTGRVLNGVVQKCKLSGDHLSVRIGQANFGF